MAASVSSTVGLKSRASRRMVAAALHGVLTWCFLQSAIIASAARLGAHTVQHIQSVRPHQEHSSSNMEPRTSRPIICILTQPGDLAGPGESYVSAGYVKWLESAGARVMPVLYDMADHEIKKRFQTCSGLLFPGGNYPLSTWTTWFRAGELLYKLAMNANANGESFPILGTCLGLQLLATIITRDYHALVPVKASNHPTHLTWTEHVRDSQLLAHVPSGVLHDLQRSDIAMHNHHYGLTDASFALYPELAETFHIVSHSQDWDNMTYVSTIEDKKYPFVGLAYHLEKSVYEWTEDLNIPHSREATDAAYHMAAAFVSLAKQNSHRGQSAEDEDSMLIYNWQPRFTGKRTNAESRQQDHPFEQVYIFRLDDVQ